MSGQEHQKHSPQDQVPDDVDAAPVPTAAPTVRDAEVDALLDEIDDVLETNAESFVRGFVQKGGQ